MTNTIFKSHALGPSTSIYMCTKFMKEKTKQEKLKVDTELLINQVIWGSQKFDTDRGPYFDGIYKNDNFRIFARPSVFPDVHYILWINNYDISGLYDGSVWEGYQIDLKYCWIKIEDSERKRKRLLEMAKKKETKAKFDICLS